MLPLIKVLIQNAIVLLVYLALSFLGRHFFSWEGIAVPFWPAAGFSVAAVSVIGYSIVPSIFLGNYIASACGLDMQCNPTGRNLFVSLGSAFQALMVGVWVYKNEFMAWSTGRPYELFKYLLLIGPMGSWPAAMILFLSYYFDGNLNPNSITVSYLWWIGDSLGVMVFLPMTLLWIPSGPLYWLKRRGDLTLPLIFLFVIPSALSLAVQDVVAATGDTSQKIPLGFSVINKIQILLASEQLVSIYFGLGVALWASEIRETADNAIARSRLASQAAAAVVHEISQPLFRLRFNIERASEAVDLAELDRPAFLGLKDTLRLCGAQIESISLLARSTQDLTLSGIRDSAYADLTVAIDRVIAQLTPLFEDRDQDFRVLGSKRPIYVATGQVQLQSALRNLLSNASHAAAEQGVIYIELNEFEQFCEIAVHDSGSGFADCNNDLGRSPASSTFNGAGIGLMIARRVVEESSGYIQFGKSSKLSGALVTLRLPKISTDDFR